MQRSLLLVLHLNISDHYLFSIVLLKFSYWSGIVHYANFNFIEYLSEEVSIAFSLMILTEKIGEQSHRSTTSRELRYRVCCSNSRKNKFINNLRPRFLELMLQNRPLLQLSFHPSCCGKIRTVGCGLQYRKFEFEKNIDLKKKWNFKITNPEQLSTFLSLVNRSQLKAVMEKTKFIEINQVCL